MAAGLGFKTFTTGEVLTAADTNGYLMQGINVFASTAARDAAITSPQEGQFAYTKDTNSLWYYTGSAWAASGATGDIEGVTAGVGITGGGTSGTVTITNDMATTITAAGDIVVGTGSGTYDNLPIGTTAQVLTADTTVSPYKVKWATPAGGGGKVLQVVFSESSADTSITGTTFTNAGASATITPTLATSKILVLSTQTVGYNVTNPATLAQGGIRLLRGATVLTATNTDGGFTILAGTTSPYGVESKNSQVVNYLDSPATTSATTYQIQLAGSGATTVVRTGFDGGVSSMVLMEIGA